ncbi:anti-sigma factor family protein [Mycolicibacterium litorale]|uniref:Anti-sigma factor n=1 Tax=Mycolicibacterium litorale TaxID=758802 RepID=A0AAD1MST1_9MYCO|nr:zf-HC2 domain-containing protein [Mycolicibacterium litorale]MCV7416291.1 zf-HC2 domain-containing protein [Mycolicibacterium litorale]TDY09544.1 putative zinc finger protein [Mycolicibacterium litorale]BBY17489.1 anti-sigma factor [Mycolicibacterium litorale]
MIEALGDPYLQWDAAYVLGSLSSADRREFEAHMQTCARCRAAVAELSGVPALLAMLDADEVRELDEDQSDEPPLRPEVLQSVLDKVKWRRRRSRWLTSAAVGLAAALLAVGLVIAIRPGAIGLQTGTPEVTAATYEMTKLAPTPFSATVSLSDFGWGTRIDMACTYGQWSGGGPGTPPSRLGMVVVGRDGSQSEIATWLGLAGATALPSGNTEMRRDEIAAVQLVSADTREVLLEKRL